LGYHLVGAGTGLAIDVSRQRFAEHLDVLSSRAKVVGLRDVVLEVRTGRVSRGERPRVVLTFDDAFLNFYDVILPILLARSFLATLYVPPGFVNGDGNHPLYAQRFAHLGAMSWDQLREAVAAGVEIGSHTYRHTNLARLPKPELIDEFHRSQAEIEEKLGVRPASVCYPEGFVTGSVCRAAGRFYESAVVGAGRPVSLRRRRSSGDAPTGAGDLLRLPRLPVRADMNAETLAAVLEQSISLEEWAADKARRLRGRIVARS